MASDLPEFPNADLPNWTHSETRRQVSFVERHLGMLVLAVKGFFLFTSAKHSCRPGITPVPIYLAACEVRCEDVESSAHLASQHRDRLYHHRHVCNGNNARSAMISLLRRGSSAADVCVSCSHTSDAVHKPIKNVLIACGRKPLSAPWQMSPNNS